MNPNSETFGFAILLATLIGPILAVIVTRYIDQYRADKQRKLDLFRTLMATRYMGPSIDKVNALNMIYVDFADKYDVILAWDKLLESYCKPVPNNDSEQELLSREQLRLTSDLLHKMALVLNIQIEPLNIHEKAYLPRSIIDNFLNQAVVQKMLVDVALGKKAIPVQIHIPNNTDHD